ncbi:MAG: hypothetical protein HUU37_09450 [Bdellovibrionales bacterium]|nr:hypothetical protein [Bdellovibrionales bacterium]
MAKKKTVKKPAKRAKKAASPLKKALKKAVKALTGSKAKNLKKAKKSAKPVKAKKLKVAAPNKPNKLNKPDKSKKQDKKKAGPVVEVVIPPSHPALKVAKKEAAAASQGKRRCREPGCDHDALMAGYCRLHYIKNWRRIKRKEAILASGQLNNYVEELVSKYPDKYLEVIRQDLASEKEWAKVVIDLELEAPEEDAATEEEAETVSDGARRERDFGDDDADF